MYHVTIGSLQAAYWSAIESLMFISDNSIAELHRLTEFAKKFEQASYQYIRPKLQPTRYSILSILEKVERLTRKDFSKTYLRPMRVVDESKRNIGEDDESFMSRVVNSEIH